MNSNITILYQKDADRSAVDNLIHETGGSLIETVIENEAIIERTDWRCSARSPVWYQNLSRGMNARQRGAKKRTAVFSRVHEFRSRCGWQNLTAKLALGRFRRDNEGVTRIRSRQVSAGQAAEAADVKERIVAEVDHHNASSPVFGRA